MTPKQMNNAMRDLGFATKKLAKSYDMLLECQNIIMRLETELFHEKWKVRYLTRRLKEIAPHEALTEEELDEQIKGQQN